MALLVLRPRLSWRLPSGVRPRCRRPLAALASAAAAVAPPKKVVVTNKAFPQTLAILEQAGLQVVANRSDEPWSPEELAARCADADAIMCFMPDRIDRDFLAQCPRLKIVGCALKGYDNFVRTNPQAICHFPPDLWAYLWTGCL